MTSRGVDAIFDISNSATPGNRGPGDRPRARQDPRAYRLGAADVFSKACAPTSGNVALRYLFAGAGHAKAIVAGAATPGFHHGRLRLRPYDGGGGQDRRARRRAAGAGARSSIRSARWTPSCSRRNRLARRSSRWPMRRRYRSPRSSRRAGSRSAKATRSWPC